MSIAPLVMESAPTTSTMAMVTVDMLRLIALRTSVRTVSASAALRRTAFRSWRRSSIAFSAAASFTVWMPPKASPMNPVTSSVADRMARRLFRISGLSALVRTTVRNKGMTRMAVSLALIVAMIASEPMPNPASPGMSSQFSM